MNEQMREALHQMQGVYDQVRKGEPVDDMTLLFADLLKRYSDRLYYAVKDATNDPRTFLGDTFLRPFAVCLPWIPPIGVPLWPLPEI